MKAVRTQEKLTGRRKHCRQALARAVDSEGTFGPVFV
jgi:hypothetical protein